MVFDADLMVGIDATADAALRSARRGDRRRTTPASRSSPATCWSSTTPSPCTAAARSRPRFDGTDRWLQRTFVVTDLAPSAADRRGRVIATEFGRAA